VNLHRFSLFQRRVGRDVRAWPMLALLVLVVVVAIGCVLWFMREAMRNERMAVREKLAEAYRGQLTLVQAQAIEQWNRRLARLDSSEPDAVRFARCVREGLVDSVICLDDQGQATYPSLTARRSAAANAELLALERLTDKTNPRFKEIAGQLGDRVNDYTTDSLPSAQRRFIMHKLQRLDPGIEFPTLAAEELAARYLEADPAFPTNTTMGATELRGVWSAASPSRGALALFTTTGLRAKLDEVVRDPSLPKGVSVTVIAPGEDAAPESTLVTVLLGPEFPGWRLALSLDDRKIFDTEADQRVARYIAVGSVVIAAMSVLAIFIARGVGRQVALARLKNDLVANVSHELKTPLTAMRALVDTLLDAERFDEKTTREYLQLLATENARLSRLIENFLTFSRLERNKFKFEFKDVRPLQVVVSTLEALGERAHAPDCTFESHVAEELPSIRGDPDALVTALLNLLDNAWKYSGDKKRIVLHADARNGNVCFSVEDNGIGLSPRDAKRVFGRFYRIDQRLASVTSGCGLGLSIVQSIVEAHSGSVRVESEPGKGSTFTIEIPAS
jgi:two-component system, OmpR family, phosphate regulon sensor histidine kinase PhoR